MERNDSINARLSRRQLLAAAARYGVGGATLASGLSVAGCKGANSYPDLAVNRTGRFVITDSFALVKDLGVNLGRTFIELQDGVPISLGWELPAIALSGLPDTDFDTPGIYFMPLPPEADVTPFKYLAFSDWARGHKPVGTGDGPHIHPLFGIAPPGAPSDDNHDEKVPVRNPDEIPAGYVLGNTIPGAGDTVASGIGEAYEYPTAPQLQPHWNTTAQNYFFYKGHLNAIGMGASYDFLASKQTNELPITQPKLYPKPSWYPTRNITTWDSKTNCHIFMLTGFIRAPRSI